MTRPLDGALQEFISTHSMNGETEHSVIPEFAPAWTLNDWRNEPVSSAQLRGKPYVLILYLGEGCLHCSEQLNAFAPTVARFDAEGIDVVTVSSDDRQTLANTISAYDDEPPFGRMLADENLKVFKQFRAYDHFADEPLHGTYLVDSSGSIRWHHLGHQPYSNPNSLLESAKRILADGVQEDEAPNPAEVPKIFLDKSSRIVAYQLSRLDNRRLLLVGRKTDDPKYAPVYSAILTRAGMSPQYREEALGALELIHDRDAVAELLAVIDEMEVGNRQDHLTATELAGMLLRQPPDSLTVHADELSAATTSENEVLRSTAFAALIVSGASETAWQLSSARESVENEASLLDWLASIRLIPDSALRSAERRHVLELLDEKRGVAVRNAAIAALRAIPESGDKTFVTVAALIENPDFRDAAVGTLLSIPDDQRNAEIGRSLVVYLVQYAESTPAELRTSNEFANAMQLADQMLKQLPIDEAKQFRQRLSEVTVRVVRIRTVEDEMRYDVPYFAVEAGRPVQVVLDNIDLMAHNLVFTKPGDLRLIADLGLQTGPGGGYEGKPYVPEHDSVLFATNMVASESREALTFDAPVEPGEYPYVCTFPQHWSRMYGVMVVVKDLDAWLKNPVKPTDPTGNLRSLVQEWTVDELKDDLEKGTQGRSLEIGHKIFVEATCAQCHKLSGEGGAVGPELDDVFTRLEGDRIAVLREILEPSHRIDEKYSMHKVLTVDGLLVTGIITSQNDEEIELIDNPESTEPIVIAVDDIEEMVKTSKSIMPKALMDNFTRDEIFELFSYLEQSQKK